MIDAFMPYAERTPTLRSAKVVYMTTRRGRPPKLPKGPPPNRMRELRERRQMTQEQVAEQLGWDARTVSRLENGDRQLKVSDLPTVARVLNCRPRQLLPDAPSDEDEQLLATFHRLGPEDRDRLVRFIEGWIEPTRAAEAESEPSHQRAANEGR